MLLLLQGQRLMMLFTMLLNEIKMGTIIKLLWFMMLLNEIEMGAITNFLWFVMLLDKIEMRITNTNLIIKLKFPRRI